MKQNKTFTQVNHSSLAAELFIATCIMAFIFIQSNNESLNRSIHFFFYPEHDSRKKRSAFDQADLSLDDHFFIGIQLYFLFLNAKLLIFLDSKMIDSVASKHERDATV